MLIENLAIATVMMAATIAVHFAGLASLIALLRAEFAVRMGQKTSLHQGATILFTVFGLVFLHSLEIWMYAALYAALGEFHDLETALYFSTTSFTTLGYGDVVISHSRRLLGAIEGANGFILIGWSTAFLVSATSRMRLLDARLTHQDLANRPGDRISS